MTYAKTFVFLLLQLACVFSDTPGDRVIVEASKYVGIQELTGENDGTYIEGFISEAGFDPKSRIPYCGAFCRAVFNRAGYREFGPQGAASAWSPNWLVDYTWKRGVGKLPEAGSTVGIYFNNLGRIAHVGLVQEFHGNYFITIEGNTGPNGSIGEKDRNGDGVYRKRRLASQIYEVRQWLP